MAPYWPFIGILVYVGFGLWGYFFHPYFTNSTFFFAATTFVVGSFAIFLYLYQKHDTKNSAARILFLELKESESEIKKLIDYRLTHRTDAVFIYPQTNIIKLIPNRAWDNYSHLFIEDFNTDEYQQLDEYFKKCILLERYFEKQHEFFWISTGERARQYEQIGAKLAYENPAMTVQNYSDSLRTIQILYANSMNYAPQAITNEINKQLDSITLPSTTPLWNKVRTLADYDK